MVIPDCTRIKHIKMSFNQGKINVIMQLKSLEYKSHDHDTKFICKIKLNFVGIRLLYNITGEDNKKKSFNFSQFFFFTTHVIAYNFFHVLLYISRDVILHRFIVQRVFLHEQ